MPRRKQPASRARLTDRDYEILDHVRRYRLTTRDVLHTLFFDDSEVNAVSKVTSRLVTAGYLDEWDTGLSETRKYFTLAAKAASVFGLSPKKCKPLGVQAFAREFPILYYCCLPKPPMERLTVSELHHRYQPLLQKGLDNSHYCIDYQGQQRIISYLRVDLGGTPDHVARKCRDDIASRKVVPAFNDLMLAGRFAIRVLTATEEKAREINRRLDERQERLVPAAAVAVPAFTEVLAALQDEDYRGGKG